MTYPEFGLVYPEASQSGSIHGALEIVYAHV